MYEQIGVHFIVSLITISSFSQLTPKCSSKLVILSGIKIEQRSKLGNVLLARFPCFVHLSQKK
jgi:hypothetical protein